MNIRSVLILVSLFPLYLGQSAFAQDADCEIIGQVISAQGSVKVQHPDSGDWTRLNRKNHICEGDTIQTGFRSRAAVSLNNESVIRINQQSKTQLANFTVESEAKSLMRMFSGVIHFFSRKSNEYAVATTTATIGIRGTEFVVSVTDGQTNLTVFEGQVEAENDVSTLALASGESVQIVSGQAMRSQILVNPRDQVQWGLYYPPVLALANDSSDTLKRAGECAQSNDFECAFAELDAVSSDARDTQYQVFLASLLLAVGDVEQAQGALAQAQAIDPDDADALALGAIIELTRNRTDQALGFAQRAVASDGDSPAALIALSYVQQAMLDLEMARDTLSNAVDKNPEHALAWARLSELQLALGQANDSRTAAERAVAIDPGVSRTQMVLGYAALGQIDTNTAIKSFETALSLDSADPMAHLGLGLGLIRDGDLEQGRNEIEAAVALDSGSAILRTYLGRAYYEEKRAPLDAEQYAMAKQLDPNDPTAYLFDALRLHSENRPVEARQQLEESIQRNDNRAVYRGRNSLDQDRAARGASLARIYDTLGFSSQGVEQASSSLAIDPANDAAHRFLSDSYQNVRRREIARVSELLQAQMLQDININPVQPSVSGSNLGIGSGAGDIGLNEFTGLFESNGVQPGISLMGGSNDTHSAEAVIAGVHDSISYSLGGFDHESDGWRDNNGRDEQLGNLFVQWAASPKLNLQAEVSSRENTEGDLSFNFDPDSFDATEETERDIDTGRIGLRFSPNPASDLLVSLITIESTEKLTFSGDFGFGPENFEGTTDEDGDQAEIQYIQKFDKVNFVAGFSKTEVDVKFDDVFTDLTGFVTFAAESEEELTHSKAYLYSTITLNQNVDLTLGVSQDDYEEGSHDESETNPKFGLRWQINDQQVFRLAAFEVMKPALVSNRTLEPTQVAGFNQFYDDLNGTQTELVGVGYDVDLSDKVAIGVEATTREMEEPTIDFFSGETLFEDREEEHHRIYLNWTPSNTLVVSGEVVYDLYEADLSFFTEGFDVPERVETVSLPISVTYFSPSGWYGGITVTGVDQEVERDDFATLASGDETFEVVDLSFGYRLPKRRGSISVVVLNVTDEEFMYQDDDYREFRNEPTTGPYFPETTVTVQANLVF